MASSPRGWLERLGLDRPELRAWALYDWANSAFVTTVIAAVFPVYFARVVAADLPPTEATVRFGLATTVALTAVAVLSPMLGALADRVGKLRLLALSVVCGVAATAGLAFTGKGDAQAALALFVAGNIALSAGFVFYDALLPVVARPAEMDRVSTAGYALGYVGGGILLAFNLACIQAPAAFGLSGSDAAVRLSFASVAVWWLLFSVPIFRRVREPPLVAVPVGAAIGQSLRQLGSTLRAVRAHPQAFLMLLAFLVYNDGIGTIIRMATIYGAEIGLDQGAMIAALLITQIVGVPFSFVFGGLAARIGAKRAVMLGLGVYLGISTLGYLMRTSTHFFVLAALVGMVQGGTQALSRSLFASLLPRGRTGEFFGFFSVSEKVAGILGPAVFAAVAAATGSSRNAIVSVIGFFLVGGALLAFVDVRAGQAAARAADGEA